MKTVKTAILAMIFLLLFSITSIGAEGIVTASSLKLRKEPSLEGEVLYGISKDSKVEIIEKTDDKWYKVKYNGYIGFVSGEYIKTAEVITTPEPAISEKPVILEEPTETEETNIYKTSSQTDIYIIPVINSSIINKIEEQKQVNVIKKINKWAYIESDEKYGWVILDKLVSETAGKLPDVTPESTPEVTPVATTEPLPTSQTTEKPIQSPEVIENLTPSPEATEKPVQNTEKVGYINVSTYANLRKEPSTESTVLDTLLRNTEVKVISEENGWSKVTVKGMTGYISKDLISSTKLEQVDTTSRGTTEQREPEKPVQEQQVAQTNADGAKIVEFAKKYLGYKYILGGTTPSGGFDCSGFVYYVFGQMGKNISRSLSVQATAGTAVSKANLQIGDIVIFNDSSNSSLGHVGIYVGNSQFIHAANPKRGVVIDYLDSRNSYYNERYVTARRV